MAKDTPTAEVDVSPELVRYLVDSQFPNYNHLPLSLIGNGWDNAMYRLGQHLSVRLPRRSLAAPLVLNEQRWLPQLAGRLPLRVPVPVGFGKPSDKYSWHWSIQPWFTGQPAAQADLDESQHLVLAEFLKQLHQPAPFDAPENRFRGTPLSARHRSTLQNIEDLADDLSNTEGLRWTPDDAMAKFISSVRVADYDGPPLWLHGDLHPLNIVVAGSQIEAVIDFGDITSGDPATDIAAGWMLFEGEQLLDFKRALGCDEDTWRRSQGWAISLGLAYLAHSADSPAMYSMGHRTLATALSSNA